MQFTGDTRDQRRDLLVPLEVEHNRRKEMVRFKYVWVVMNVGFVLVDLLSSSHTEHVMRIIFAATHLSWISAHKSSKMYGRSASVWQMHFVEIEIEFAIICTLTMAASRRARNDHKHRAAQ